MPVLRPDSDVSATGWTSYPSNAGGIAANLAAGKPVHRAGAVRETRRTIMFGCDDARWDYRYGTLTGSGRAGQLALQTVHDLFITGGTDCLAHRTSLGPCWTARCEWHTGLFFYNHGMCAHDTTANGYRSDYVARYITGTKDVPGAGGRAVNQWMGPWGQDLALGAGYGRQRVSRAQQSTDGHLRDADDDLQAYSGALWQQLAREGIHVGFFGKLSNPRDIFDPIPAGIEYADVQLEDPSATQGDDSQLNLYLQRVRPTGTASFGVYIGANPFDGAGVTVPVSGGGFFLRSYAGKAINNITWAGGTATATCSVAHGLDATAPTSACPEQVTLVGTSNGYDGSYIVTGVGSNSTFTFATANSAGSTGGNAFNRMNYGPLYYARQTILYMETLSNSAPFFINFTARTPHDNNGSYNSSTHEQEYAGAMDTTQATCFLGANGVASPVLGNLSTAAKSAWGDCLQMMASLDDAIKLITTYCTNRWGSDGWNGIFTSDQGIQNNEQGASYVNTDGTTIPSFGDGAGKTFVWDGSARAPLHLRGSMWTAGATITQPTIHADIPLTILALFGLTDHHWLTVDGNQFHTGTRDGRPLQVVTNASDVAHNRMLPVFGDFKTGAGSSNRGWGIVDKTNRKFIELNNTKSTGKLFWPDPNAGSVVYNSVTIHPAYEQAQITPTTADLNAYDTALDTAFAFRFDPSSGAGTNPAHTTASP